MANGLSVFDANPTASPVVFDYFKAKQATDIDFEIYGSTDLDSWTGESVTPPMTASGLLFEHMQVELSTDFNALPRKFFSLGVTRSVVPPP